MRIAIIAGELSGDKIGAGLIKALKHHIQSDPDYEQEPEFIGIGGPAMISEGCNSLYPQEKLSVMGIVEVIKHYSELSRLRKALIKRFIEEPPDVFIGVDSPGFNLGIEDKLKQAGVKTVHYVSPQVWAWRKWRIKKIARAVDLMLTVLPFEEAFYRKNGIEAVFVGHPRADEIPEKVDQQVARKALSLPLTSPVIAVLPGSRANEWHYHMQIFVDTIKWCLQQNSELIFTVALVNDRAETAFKEHLQGTELPIKLIKCNSFDVIAASDVVLTVSGTAALEIMLLKKPMVVAYRMSGISYQVARRLVTLPFISLPNLLLEEACVPEFVQHDVKPAKLGAALLEWLDKTEKAFRLHDKFQDIHRQLRCGASDQAARAILKLCKT